MAKPKAHSFFLFLWILLSCGEKPKEDDTLIIAVSANMQFASAEIAQSFSEKTGIPFELVVGSSGKLTAQIREGAPFDIFLSANMKYPEELYATGHTKNKPKIYAYGKLVLWTMVDDLEPSLQLLQTDMVSHIAIANPNIAPYGKAAMEVLEGFEILNEVESKLVFAESIAQANQFVISKSAEMGFTSKSVVISPQIRGKGHWIEVNESSYTPIAQGAVILKQRGKILVAQKFFDYLYSKEAQNILHAHGYDIL
ncbi:molybdate ABC transporter substrate-binding protein [Flagellimonas allohymeniacidonis]|uniref:Molybdate ABC transporter substrate-binding protein n=1 Tax=Flagellimonas allohymeniacidonis TaxID=2517819 RepID=A0A4Q8QH90_9FLAO|nr:molybdate ABC transporter substrate-binding protein [Allomuricauda hymeniacidonis]TAI47769.1 molybdate ABC transporter substrate-binding protein [Allomuricauda hymeniacidonis]